VYLNVQMAIMGIPPLINVKHVIVPVQHAQEGQHLIARPVQILRNLYIMENVYHAIHPVFDADGRAPMAV